MSIDQRLLTSIMNNNMKANDYLIGNQNSGYLISKPQVDIKIKSNINWDKKCASLSIEFKLFFI